MRVNFSVTTGAGATSARSMTASCGPLETSLRPYFGLIQITFEFDFAAFLAKVLELLFSQSCIRLTRAIGPLIQRFETR